jgi:hypothetical protein
MHDKLSKETPGDSSAMTRGSTYRSTRGSYFLASARAHGYPSTVQRSLRFFLLFQIRSDCFAGSSEWEGDEVRYSELVESFFRYLNRVLIATLVTRLEILREVIGRARCTAWALRFP